MNADLVEVLTESRRLGFLGPGPVEDHIAHALAFVSVMDVAPARTLDLGAGGGLPGLVLAASGWAGEICLLDSQLRRTDFLREAVDALGLAARVRVVTGRAEEFARIDGERGSYDVVVSRSFGAPAVVAECAAPLLCTGGQLVVSEPPTSDADQRWPADGLAQVGLGPAVALVAGEVGAQAHLVRMTQIDPAPDRLPRRTGIPAKRPLF